MKIREHYITKYAIDLLNSDGTISSQSLLSAVIGAFGTEEKHAKFTINFLVKSNILIYNKQTDSFTLHSFYKKTKLPSPTVEDATAFIIRVIEANGRFSSGHLLMSIDESMYISEMHRVKKIINNLIISKVLGYNKNSDELYINHTKPTNKSCPCTTCVGSLKLFAIK